MSGSPALTARCEALLAPRIEARIVPGLERITAALDALGRPQRMFRSALVVGTNGKGSTAALLAGMLTAHGLRVGLYTSPHLVSVRERIRINGKPLAAADMLRHLRRLGAFTDLSYFETVTAAAVLAFAGRAVDVAVIEAGIGGRWDAARAVGATVGLLTNVGTDHRAWLGDDRAAIAAEKAAALSGQRAIVGAWDAEVEPAIRRSAAPGTPVSLASKWAAVTELRPSGSGLREATPLSPFPPLPSCLPSGARRTGPGALVVDGTPVGFSVAGVHGEAVLPLPGEHQLANLRLALAGFAALVELLPSIEPDAAALARGISATRWPGRLQWLQWEGRTLLLDGAHNLEATATLAAFLDARGLSGRIDLLFSCLADKPLEEMARLLSPRVRRVVVAPIRSPRATSLAALAAAFPEAVRADDVGRALAGLPPGGVTLVSGSLRLVGEVLGTTGGGGV